MKDEDEELEWLLIVFDTPTGEPLVYNMKDGGTYDDFLEEMGLEDN